jgi:hypothetical protein
MPMNRIKLNRMSGLAASFAGVTLVFFVDIYPVNAEGPTTAVTGPADGAVTTASAPALAGGDMTMSTFLDRLMIAESGGRDTVANPRSSAVGAFQFISSTFIDVARRHFAAETANLSPTALLALRTDRAFARRAAEAYTQDNANYLSAARLSPTWPNLRLAFFAGPEGAVKILKSAPTAPVRGVLGAAIVAANPFLANYTANDLVARSVRDLQVASADVGGLAPNGRPGAKKTRTVQIPVLCDLGQASCRRWLALAQRRLASKAVTPKPPGVKPTGAKTT